MDSGAPSDLSRALTEALSELMDGNPPPCAHSPVCLSASSPRVAGTTLSPLSTGLWALPGRAMSCFHPQSHSGSSPEGTGGRGFRVKRDQNPPLTGMGLSWGLGEVGGEDSYSECSFTHEYLVGTRSVKHQAS